MKSFIQEPVLNHLSKTIKKHKWRWIDHGLRRPSDLVVRAGMSTMTTPGDARYWKNKIKLGMIKNHLCRTV